MDATHQFIISIIPKTQFSNNLSKIESVLTGIEPFELDLSTVGQFNFGRNNSIHLVPEPQDKVKELQHALKEIFPYCDDLSNKSGNGFQGHLTLGQASTFGVNDLKSKITNTLKLPTWKVDEVCLISRNNKTSFEIEHRIQLGTKKVQDKPRADYKPQIPKSVAKPKIPLPESEAKPKIPIPISVAKPKIPKPESEINDDNPLKPKSEANEKLPKPKSQDQGLAFPFKIPEVIPSVSFQFKPEDYYPKVQKRFERWIFKLKDSSRLPKTRVKLINSIKQFCIIRYPVISAEYIYARLYEQNYIDVDEEEELILIHRKFEGFPSPDQGLAHWTKELNELQLDAATKCFNWVSALKAPPESFWALRHSIDQLCLGRREIDPSAFLEYLSSKKIIEIDDENNITYFYQKLPWISKNNKE